MPFAACQSVTIALPRVILECTTHNGVVEWMVLSLHRHKHQDPIVLLTLLNRGNNNLAEPTARVLKGGASLTLFTIAAFHDCAEHGVAHMQPAARRAVEAYLDLAGWHENTSHHNV